MYGTVDEISCTWAVKWSHCEISICVRHVSYMENNVIIVQILDELVCGVERTMLITAYPFEPSRSTSRTSKQNKIFSPILLIILKIRVFIQYFLCEYYLSRVTKYDNTLQRVLARIWGCLKRILLAPYVRIVRQHMLQPVSVPEKRSNTKPFRNKS